MSALAVVSISGGKDSLATAICALDAYGPERVRLVMADTGHEHPETMAYVRDYLPGALGLPITILRADFSARIEGKRRYIMTHWEYEGVPLEKIDRALAILKPTGNPYLDLCVWKGRFPSGKARFCTEELKRNPLDEYFERTIAEVHPVPVESWLGIRRDESATWRDAAARDEPTMDRPWAIVRPIVDWTAEQTIRFAQDRQIKHNPLYSQGMRRVGCMPCINCGKDELLEISMRWPEEVARVREWEKIVTDASKRDGATFFADPVKQGNRRRAGEHAGYLKIDGVIRWAGTTRGGKQMDLERAIPPQACSSVYGLCE